MAQLSGKICSQKWLKDETSHGLLEYALIEDDPVRQIGEERRIDDEAVFNYFSMRVTHSLWNRLRVDVHGRPNIGVPQQLLLYFHVDTERSQ